MPTNAKKNVYKEKEFQTYVLWKSLPAFFRGMQKKELQSYGFTDPLILKIVSIKNQTTFAKKFGIKDLGTLTDWNNRIKNNNLETFTLNTIFKKEFEKIPNKITPPLQKKSKKKGTKKYTSLIKEKPTVHVQGVKKTDLKTEETIAPVKRTISQKIRDVLIRWRMN